MGIMRIIKMLFQAGLINAARLALLVMARASTKLAAILQQAVLAMDIRRERLGDLEIRPVFDLPEPQINLAAGDPIAALMTTPEFGRASAYFADNPVTKRSLISPQAQALLYCIVRLLKPDNVFEIGTYRAGTTEAICRALVANGRGIAHAVDPFCAEHIKAVFRGWPSEMLGHVKLYPTDSMVFFKEMERDGIRPSLVFVDGNHDYEFALFDIGCAARAMLPGGFIFVDNIAQVGPFFAARDFLIANPSWKELGSSAQTFNPDKAHDRERTTIPNTDFMAIQAPSHYEVDNRPRNFNLVRWLQSSVAGVRLKVHSSADQATGLTVQIVFRGFGTQLVELVAETTVHVTPGTSELTAAFTPALQLTGDYTYFSVEPWLVWRGRDPLQLLQLPDIF